MTSLNGIDLEEFLRLSALSENGEEDDESEGALFADADDDDDDDDDDDEGFEDFLEEDDDDDDDDDEGVGDADVFPERRRRSRRPWRRRRYRRVTPRRRLNRVRGSRSTTLRSPSGQRMRVHFGKSYATTAEVNKLIKSTERKFADAMKERKANHSRLSKQIASSAKAIDGRVSAVRKKVKKLEDQSKTSALMSLLGGAPRVKTIKFERPTEAGAEVDFDKELKAKVEFEKPDMLLPLLLSGGLGGSGSGDNSMLMLALAFQNKKDD